MKKILMILFFSLVSSNPSLSGDPCIAWEEKTDNLVLGDCSNDMFTGYVMKTNTDLLGTCDDGMIIAWNDRTNYMIMGSCDAGFNQIYREKGLKKFK